MLINGSITRSSDPRGPATVTLRFAKRRYVVISFFTMGSPIVSSTPGGMEMGVRPSLDGRVVVAEKCRVGVAAPVEGVEEGVRVWKAGARKDGTVTVEGLAGVAEASTLSRSRIRLGASILVVGAVSIGCCPDESCEGGRMGPR